MSSKVTSLDRFQAALRAFDGYGRDELEYRLEELRFELPEAGYRNRQSRRGVVVPARSVVAFVFGATNTASRRWTYPYQFVAVFDYDVGTFVSACVGGRADLTTAADILKTYERHPRTVFYEPCSLARVLTFLEENTPARQAEQRRWEERALEKTRQREAEEAARRRGFMEQYRADFTAFCNENVPDLVDTTHPMWAAVLHYLWPLEAQADGAARRLVGVR